MIIGMHFPDTANPSLGGIGHWQGQRNVIYCQDECDRCSIRKSQSVLTPTPYILILCSLAVAFRAVALLSTRLDVGHRGCPSLHSKHVSLLVQGQGSTGVRIPNAPITVEIFLESQMTRRGPPAWEGVVAVEDLLRPGVTRAKGD